MSPAISRELYELVRSLFEKRSLLDRALRQDHRLDALERIVASREVRVVPDLLQLLASDNFLASNVGRAIAELIREVTPVQLSWLDEKIRHSSDAYYSSDGWRDLTPPVVSRLAQTADLDTTVVGLVASHANGFVRAAALERLGQDTSGPELAFLALRVNDWVEPVSARASELLINRLRSDNRRQILNALPFIVRVFGQHRRDHRSIECALKSVLLSDGGEDALAHAANLGTSARRMMYRLVTNNWADSSRGFLDAALNDPDPVIRARALRSVAADESFTGRVAILERLLHEDPVPAVRRLALASLSERVSNRIAGVFPNVLLDPSARVRGLARFVAATHHLPVVPRDVYLESLAHAHPKEITATIEGIGETGTRADAALVTPHLASPAPRNRRAVLRALAKLDVERAIPSAIEALADCASSVRAAAVHILSTNARRVDFEIVSRHARSLTDARVRRSLLPVFMKAPKWEAVALLLEALWDSDERVRVLASRLIDRWINDFNRSHTQPTVKQLERIHRLLDSAALRMPEQTAKMLRFSLKPL